MLGCWRWWPSDAVPFCVLYVRYRTWYSDEGSTLLLPTLLSFFRFVRLVCHPSCRELSIYLPLTANWVTEQTHTHPSLTYFCAIPVHPFFPSLGWVVTFSFSFPSRLLSLWLSLVHLLLPSFCCLLQFPRLHGCWMIAYGGEDMHVFVWLFVCFFASRPPLHSFLFIHPRCISPILPSFFIFLIFFGQVWFVLCPLPFEQLFGFNILYADHLFLLPFSSWSLVASPSLFFLFFFFTISQSLVKSSFWWTHTYAYVSSLRISCFLLQFFKFQPLHRPHTPHINNLYILTTHVPFPSLWLCIFTKKQKQKHSHAAD